jgi:hypothetical protein
MRSGSEKPRNRRRTLRGLEGFGQRDRSADGSTRNRTAQGSRSGHRRLRVLRRRHPAGSRRRRWRWRMPRVLRERRGSSPSLPAGSVPPATTSNRPLTRVPRQHTPHDALHCALRNLLFRRACSFRRNALFPACNLAIQALRFLLTGRFTHRTLAVQGRMSRGRCPADIERG